MEATNTKNVIDYSMAVAGPYRSYTQTPSKADWSNGKVANHRDLLTMEPRCTQRPCDHRDGLKSSLQRLGICVNHYRENGLSRPGGPPLTSPCRIDLASRKVETISQCGRSVTIVKKSRASGDYNRFPQYLFTC